MKKTSLILITALIVAFAFVGCATAKEEPVVIIPGVEQAAKFVSAVYDKSTPSNPVTRTASDYSVNDIVIVNGVQYSIEWTTDCSDAVVGTADSNHAVLITINPEAKEETQYTLTGTITDPETAETAVVEIKHVLPKGKAKDMTYEQIVDMVYALESGENTSDTYRLYGTVVAIPTAWSDTYGNITVNMVVDGREDNVIQCYRLTGEGASEIKVGDKITVEGTFTNYKGTYEFNKNCVLVGFGNYPDQSKVVENIYQLASGEKQTNMTVLTGTISKIVSAWSDKYGNITVDFIPDGCDENHVVEAYRLTGVGAAELNVGDKITVFGQIKRYKDTFEFDTGCVLVANELYNSVKNIIQAYELEAGESLEGTRTVTGVISAIPSAYSEQYGNITVDLDIAGITGYTIQAYRLLGGADLAVGDTITVTGTVKNYKGAVEFDKNCTYTK